MGIRKYWHRILVGSTPVLAESEQPVKINEALEDSATYVAEFTAASVNAASYLGQSVTIDQVKLDTVGGILQMRRQFTGLINSHSVVAFPHQQSVVCTGRLHKLRKRRQGSDYNLTGKTDTQAVKDLLTLCGVSYTSADIKGWNYPLGQIKPVYWRVGQPAIEVVAELDRVFACATIEVGNGRVMRFPYSKVPADYASGLYGGYNVQWRFIAGQGNVFFYNNERNRGAVDDIQNFWRVEGLRWTDDNGCERQIIAEAIADHPVYGSGFTAGPETFSSEFIQTEALAKAVAIRLMRWHNRVPDVVRIETANIATIMPGDLIAVLDPAQAIDLSTETVYVVTSVSREGDLMTLEAVGGAAGPTGTVTSSIEVCCGTQREDGTCTDAGTNPGAATGPSPGVPANPPLTNCDPLEDATCIPGEDYPLIDPPNIFDPLINCYRNGTLTDDCSYSVGEEELDECHTGSVETTSTIGSPPPNACVSPSWRFRTYTRMFEDGSVVNCKIHVNWRKSGGGGHLYRLTDGGAVDALGVYATWAQWTFSTESDPSLQSSANDVIFGAPLAVTVSGVIHFLIPGSSVRIFFHPGFAGVTFYADPGLQVNAPGRPTEYYGITASTEDQAPLLVGTCPPNTSRGALCRNNGGYMGSPGMGAVPFSVSFDESYQRGWGRVVVSSGMGGGYIAYNDFLNPSNPLPGEPADPISPCGDSHSEHRLYITISPGDGSSDPQSPAAYITGLVVGYQTCEQNPHYLNVPSDMG